MGRLKKAIVNTVASVAVALSPNSTEYKVNPQSEEVIFKPQAGKQTAFLSSSADICIYGGAAGGGKTFALLMETVRYTSNGDFSCIVLRRSKAQVRQKGGIWDESYKFYPKFDPTAKPNGTFLTWTFPSGATIGFSAIQHDKDKYNFDGAQIPLICFDELQHFTEDMFFYMLSRNRSGQCKGIKPYIRATCNPKPNSWLKRFIRWWLDEEGRYADESKSGVIRWFIRDGEKIVWANSKEDLVKDYPKSNPLSVTFIPSSLADNPELLKNDPDYEAKIESLPYFERLRLKGDWKVEPVGGLVFQKEWFKKLINIPSNIIELIRYWDRASTETKTDVERRQKKGKNDPDSTSGVLMARCKGDIYVALDRVSLRGTPATVQNTILSTSQQDRMNYPDKPYSIGIEQDPAQAGKVEVDLYRRLLSGFAVKAYPARQNKITRASGLSSLAENGNFYVLDKDWTEDYINQLVAFPDGPHDDDVDASSGAFNALSNNPVGEIKEIKTSGKLQDFSKYR